MRQSTAIIISLAVAFSFGILTYICMVGSENKFMGLGDEVTTIDEYTMLFNDSFTGRVVAIDKLYTVRDENGTERTFAWKWIDHVDVEGDI